jgi:hypothetical protein
LKNKSQKGIRLTSGTRNKTLENRRELTNGLLWTKMSDVRWDNSLAKCIIEGVHVYLKGSPGESGAVVSTEGKIQALELLIRYLCHDS